MVHRHGSSDETREELERLREQHHSLFVTGGFFLFAVIGLGAYLVVGFLGLVPVPQWVIVVWGLALLGDIFVLLQPESRRLGKLSAEQDEER